jgi:chromate transporter
MFFSGAAVVTFGGAYAVLAYVGQLAVTVFHWLTSSETVNGLALAVTTPRPLIMVVKCSAGNPTTDLSTTGQSVFKGDAEINGRRVAGAYRDPDAPDPWVAAVLTSLLVVWVTFVPCFLFAFLGAPDVEWLRPNLHVTAALTGVTAAVVGVIASPALFFAAHTLHRCASGCALNSACWRVLSCP